MSASVWQCVLIIAGVHGSCRARSRTASMPGAMRVPFPAPLPPPWGSTLSGFAPGPGRWLEPAPITPLCTPYSCVLISATTAPVTSREINRKFP